MSETNENLPARRAPEGFVTQARPQAMSPALLAEQQRAKTEIEAALTIARAQPRDEKEAMDHILISCQRPGLAAKAQYQYARGGTDISGASIRLMEAIAQRWRNIDFGWRELQRFPGVGGKAGLSIVEAYAWDMESNVKPRIQFNVEHQIKRKDGTFKILTDPRDIFEYVSNQASRRVRKCLEQVIPRDIVEAACGQCDLTLKAEIKDVPEATKKMLAFFAEEFGVTKAQIEARIQRRVESITPSQLIALRKIGTSLRDGMSEPDDWFPADPAGQGEGGAPTPTDEAKATMRQRQEEAASKAKAKAKAKPKAEPADNHEPPPEGAGEADGSDGPGAASEPPHTAVEPPPEPAASEPAGQLDDDSGQAQGTEGYPEDVAAAVEGYKWDAEGAETLTGLRELRKKAMVDEVLKEAPDALSNVLQMISAAEAAIKESRRAG